jgi:hypothetical protein
MRAMLVVAMQPRGQFFGALAPVLVGAHVGPFGKRGPDEALGLAIGLGSVRASERMLNAQALTGSTEALRAIAGAVVVQQARYADAGDYGTSKPTAEQNCSCLLKSLARQRAWTMAASLVIQVATAFGQCRRAA